MRQTTATQPGIGKTVLVTGGAGFLGINLLRYLHARGYDLVSLDFADFTYPDMADKVFIVKGDIRDPKAVAKAMQGVDLVVHAAAALPLYTPEDIHTTDVDGTHRPRSRPAGQASSAHACSPPPSTAS
ncbi:MAG: NAD-dependent epimerase/dehydratase family protein [Thermomicrobiales bacterium]